MNWFIPITVTFGGWLTGGFSTMTGLWEDKAPKTPKTTTLRIWVGMDPDYSHRDTSKMAGTLPMAHVWDERGETLGGAWGIDSTKSAPEGSFQEYHIEQTKSSRPSYLQLSSIADWSKDAVCIAAIAVMYPDGGQASILGDVPHGFCNWTGYPSITELDFDGKGTTYRPFCFWMDRDDSNANKDNAAKPWNPTDHVPLSVSFHLPDFNGQNATNTAYNCNKDLLCRSSPRMLARQCKEKSIPIFDPPLTYGNQAGQTNDSNFLDADKVLDASNEEWPQSRGGPHRIRTCSGPERRRSPKKKRFEGQWVHSQETKPQFSATEVCKMPGLRGPHYANVHEGKFCNVDDRSIWDICGADTVTNCFDIIREELIVEEAQPYDPVTGAVVLGALPRPRAALKLNKRIDMK